MKHTLSMTGAIGVLAWIGLIVVNVSPPTWADTPDISANDVAQTFSVANMTCAACPLTVKKAMTRVEGVKSVDVDFEARTATAVFDATVTSANEIAAASTDVGYPASPLQEEGL